MGVSVGCDDDDEHRRTHPLLMPKIESERTSVTDGEILEKVAVVIITDKVAHGDLKIEHMGTDDMWGDVNTKPTQGKRFRIMRAEVMGVSVDYDDDDERRRTHPLLMPKIESERISVTDGEILEKVAVVIPVKTPVKCPEKGKTGGVEKGSIPPSVKPVAKQRSVLGEDKYSHVEGAM